jgi:predicted ATP-grasp superfamily ATP-dependent carboligase
MKLIGCFGHTLDPLSLSPAVRSSLVVFLPKGDKRLQQYYKDFRTATFEGTKSKVIEEMADLDIVRLKSFQRAAAQSGITHLLVSHRSSKELFAKVRSLNIVPLGNDYRWAMQFENKRFFDTILTKLALPKPRTLCMKDLQQPCDRVVVQEIDSFGSFGTKIVPSHVALKLLQKRTDRSSLMTRAFIPGDVYGITMLIKGTSFALSALRQQCYYSAGLVFAGVQWVPTQQFSAQLIGRIETIFKKIARFCMKQGIEGILNFDFIVDTNQQPYILECNPRPSSATPHLLKHPALIHHIDLSAFMTGQLTSMPHHPRLPRHQFRGALLDLMVPHTMTPRQVRTASHALRVARQQQYPATLFTHLVSKPTFKRHDFLGMILSEKTLFSRTGTLLPQTSLLYETITGITLQKS